MGNVPTDFLTLDEPMSVECWQCSADAEIVEIAKVFEHFEGIQRGKDTGENSWKPVGSGWECPSCRDD